MKEKLLKIIKENGFLLFLFMCVCMVAASTIFVITNEVDKPGDKEFVIIEDEELDSTLLEDEYSLVEDAVTDYMDTSEENSEEEVLETSTNEDPVEEDEDNSEEGMDSEEEPVEEKEIEEDTEEVTTEEPISEDKEDDIEFIDDYKEEPTKNNESSIKPVEGEVITVFTTDSLIYSKTLDEWRGHPGIDIKAKVGEKVKAVRDGTVKSVEEDKLWGITVVIDHGDGVEAKYANLGTKEMVKEGVQVKQGDFIGTVGKTADIEMLMEDHLHFEVTKDGKLVDPRSILE